MARVPLRILQGVALPLVALALAACSAGGGGGGGGGGSAAPAGAGAATSGQLKVLTYNVAGLPDFLSQSNPAKFMPLISPLINAYDLVLVQEDFSYHAQLAASSTHPYASQPMGQPVTLMNDGLNRFSVFPLDPVDRQRWNQCHGFWDNGADCLADKGFTFGRVEVAPGAVIHVYNHHADAGSGQGDVDARRTQMTQLVTYITTHSIGHAVIVAGDTNLGGFDPDDEPVLQVLLAGAGLLDACRELGCPKEKIDRVMYRDGGGLDLEPVAWRIATEFVDPNGTDLSDHDAIHVDLSWRKVP